MYVDAIGGKKRSPDSLEMALWAVMSPLMLMLGSELGSWKSRKCS